jgi:hypothetical protein
VADTGYGQDAGAKTYAALEVAILAWSPGWNFLGANVLMSVTEPVFGVDLYGAAVSGTAVGPPFTGTTFYPTVHNMAFNPLTLSWNLGQGWFTSAGLTVFAPDGSMYQGTLNPDYWTVEPRFAISYLGGGWDLTANLIYDFNGTSCGITGPMGGIPTFAPYANGYHSGDQTFVDVTATKRLGKWEIGPVATFEWQPTSDAPGSRLSCAQMAAASAGSLTCGRANEIALGGLVGYDFGSTVLQLFVTDSVYATDAISGLAIWSRLSFRLWAPDPPNGPTSGKN